MIIVIGTAEARPEHMDRIMALSLEHVRRSRQEPGCLRHDVSVDGEHQARLVFVEYWKDMDALNAHFAVPASQAFIKDLTPLLAEPPTLEVFQSDAVA